MKNNKFFLKSSTFFSRVRALDPTATLAVGVKNVHTKCCACTSCSLNNDWTVPGFILTTTLNRTTLKKSGVFVSATDTTTFL